MGHFLPGGESGKVYLKAHIFLGRQVRVVGQLAAIADGPVIGAETAVLMDLGLEPAADGGVLQGHVSGQNHPHFVQDDGVTIVAEVVAREEPPLKFGVLAPYGPFDLDGIADFQAGKRDDQLLVGIVDLGFAGQVAHLDMARLDRNRSPVGLVDLGVVQGQSLVGGCENDIAIIADFLYGLAAIEARDLVTEGFDGAVGLDELSGSRVENAGRGVVEKAMGDTVPESRIIVIGDRLMTGTAGHRPAYRIRGPEAGRREDQEDSQRDTEMTIAIEHTWTPNPWAFSHTVCHCEQVSQGEQDQ